MKILYAGTGLFHNTDLEMENLDLIEYLESIINLLKAHDNLEIHPASSTQGLDTIKVNISYKEN